MISSRLRRWLGACVVLAHPAFAAAQATPDVAPPGEPIPVDGIRPAAMPGAWRVSDAPLAVHAPEGTPLEHLVRVRDEAARALNALEGTFGLPAPAPDGTRGGGPELDVYLVPEGPDVDVEIDALEYGAAWDRASAFVQVREGLEGDRLRRAVTEGVAQAMLLGIDARAARPWRIALATAFADHATGLGPDLEAWSVFQRDPARALFRGRDDASARGASMFPEFLARRYDREDLSLLRGLAWMPVSLTPDDAPRLTSVPNVFDALERLLRDEFGGLDGVLGAFATARGVVGTYADIPTLADGIQDWALTPRFTAALHYPQLPAWVTPEHVLDETGMAYVLVDTQDAGSQGALHLWFHGVPWRRWGVDVTKLNERGRPAGHLPPTPVRAGEWSLQIEALEDVSSVLVTVVDLGNGNYDPTEAENRAGWFALNVAR